MCKISDVILTILRERQKLLGWKGWWWEILGLIWQWEASLRISSGRDSLENYFFQGTQIGKKSKSKGPLEDKTKVEDLWKELHIDIFYELILECHCST